ncbi:MAG: hypothetical protein ABIO71_06530 [Caldimonas sp.]
MTLVRHRQLAGRPPDDLPMGSTIDDRRGVAGDAVDVVDAVDMALAERPAAWTPAA